MSRQEEAWAGEFGDAYHRRNAEHDEKKLAHFFLEAVDLAYEPEPKTVIEFGAGDGRNLVAVTQALPDVQTLCGIEVNDVALLSLVERAHGIPDVSFAALKGSILDGTDRRADLVFTKGLLIHVPPIYLEKAYRTLYTASLRYILLCEYYAPHSEEIADYASKHGGHDAMCWRGDFAGGMLKAYPDLTLVDYGFVYHGDDSQQEDDVTWFLLEKAR